MSMIEGTAFAFLKVGSVAVVVMVAIIALCRFLMKRQREKLERGDPS